MLEIFENSNLIRREPSIIAIRKVRETLIKISESDQDIFISFSMDSILNGMIVCLLVKLPNKKSIGQFLVKRK